MSLPVPCRHPPYTVTGMEIPDVTTPSKVVTGPRSSQGGNRPPSLYATFRPRCQFRNATSVTLSLWRHCREDPKSNIAKLEAVRNLGVSIALDDFGTGYSSLGYLAKLTVETLKIVRSFTGSMLDDPSAMTLVSTIIDLGYSLKLTVVAEGV